MELNGTGNQNSVILDCPNFSQSDNDLLDFFSFWVEGVLTTIVAILGIFGNTIVSIIIVQKEMRNSFNLLLVSLACFDSTYLFGSILESFRKDFNLASQTHIILFPYFLYPINQVAISGSIFMTVAIAWERYVAVHYPMDYNQAVNDANAIRNRLQKYVGPVTLLALAFNVVKFFEAKVEYKIKSADTNKTDPNLINNNEIEAAIRVTPLRTHPAYSAYNNWSRLIVLGIIPFALLVFFNTKIYKDISERRNRRIRLSSTTNSRASVTTELTTEYESLPAHSRNGSCFYSNSSNPFIQLMKQSFKRKIINDSSNSHINNDEEEEETTALDPNAINTNQENQNWSKKCSEELVSDMDHHPSTSSYYAQQQRELRKSCLKKSLNKHINSSQIVNHTVSFERSDTQPIETLGLVTNTISENNTHAVLTMAAVAAASTASMTSTDTRLQIRQVQQSNERRRIFEDNLASVCVGFVLVFLICHSPRLFMNIHEIITIHEAVLCSEKGYPPFSVWSLIFISISHFLLVLNSATNILVYCLLSTKFREECANIFKTQKIFICCLQSQAPRHENIPLDVIEA